MSKRWVCFAAAALMALPIPGFAEIQNVQVRKTMVRERPSLFGGGEVGQLEYGDSVNVVEQQGAWSRVQAGAVSGWVQSSALTKKTITRSTGGDVSTAASGNELALAGKGFNQQVEDEFKKQNREIDFTPVDRMEKIVIGEKEILDFLQQGDLSNSMTR